MFKGNDIRAIWSAYTPSSMLHESISTESEHGLPDIGVKIVRNDQGENDGDRYYSTWEIQSIQSGSVIDWDYVDGEETIQDVAAKVSRTYNRSGRPTFR